MLKALAGLSHIVFCLPTGVTAGDRPQFLARPSIGLRRILADAGRPCRASDWARITRLAAGLRRSN